jgi:hypothetical protein
MSQTLLYQSDYKLADFVGVSIIRCRWIAIHRQKVVNLFWRNNTMGGSSFDLLMQEVINQKQYLEQLIEENQNLQRQLADLRAGQGIILEVCGQQFSLNGNLISDTSSEEVSPVQDTSIPQATMSMPLSDTPASAIPETELAAEPLSNDSEQQLVSNTPSFLEELLVDEFTAAATSPMQAWKNAQTQGAGQSASEEIDEDEKAALRRELIGSFLLE